MVAPQSARFGKVVGSTRKRRSLPAWLYVCRIHGYQCRLSSASHGCQPYVNRIWSELARLKVNSIAGLQTRQIGETRGLAFVPGKQKTQPLIDAFIDQKLHEARASRSLRASPSASKATLRGTVGNPARKSSRVSPPSRYSNIVCTGTRVPRNTGIPCITSGS